MVEVIEQEGTVGSGTTNSVRLLDGLSSGRSVDSGIGLLADGGGGENDAN